MPVDRMDPAVRSWILIGALALVGISTGACAGSDTPRANAEPMACAQLATLALPETTILSAQHVEAGAFVPPSGGGRGGAVPAYDELPAFCRVEALASRTGGSDVKIEVWMPQVWSGDFQPAASGFAGGTIGYGGMADILGRGHATANTNRGHDGGGPWQVADMGHEPYHLMVDRAKTLIEARYGRGPTFTFMNECGGGGTRDALMLAQEWPGDLDAAVAVGFVYHSTRHGVGQAWVYQATHKDEASYVPPSKYPIIHEAALAACDAKDGVTDGIIEDPPRCDFDPGVLLCQGADGPDCLTAPQVEAVRRIYSPAVNPRTGEYHFAPMPPGSELGWEAMAGPSPYIYVPPFFRFLVFDDPAWDIDTRPVDFDADVALAERPENLVINATNADLTGFLESGGKLLLMGGWNDHTLAPGSFVDYYEAVVETTGEQVRDAVRLFMVPGMDHCLGRDYASSGYEVDAVAIVREWHETGVAPDSIGVTHFTDQREDGRRLVCAYPQIAQYDGEGDTNDPENFSCVMP